MSDRHPSAVPSDYDPALAALIAGLAAIHAAPLPAPLRAAIGRAICSRCGGSEMDQPTDALAPPIPLPGILSRIDAPPGRGPRSRRRL